MKPFRMLAATLALLFGLQAVPAMAGTQTTGSGDPVYDIQNPPAFAMIADLLIARPLLIAIALGHFFELITAGSQQGHFIGGEGIGLMLHHIRQILVVVARNGWPGGDRLTVEILQHR